MGLRVLVVEDQRDIAANLWDFLERRGYQVDHAADGETGLRSALRGDADLIVLDLGLPRLDGLELCQRLRGAGCGVPVLMLTARDGLEDKLRGFADGADDYMVKPFELRELDARLQALHRRSRPPPAPVLTVGDLVLHSAAMLAKRAGRWIALTRAQAKILGRLMRESPSIVTHAALIREVWGAEGGDVAALHTHIYTLRTLVDDEGEGTLIQSAHGLGYRLVPRA